MVLFYFFFFFSLKANLAQVIFSQKGNEKKKKKSIYQDIFLLVGKYQRTNFATKSYLHFMKNQ